MFKKEVIVKSPLGLHARPAAYFVGRANAFSSNIFIRVNDQDFNAKSIISILAAGAEQGMSIEIVAEGKDEEKAVLDLVAFVESGLGEK